MFFSTTGSSSCSSCRLVSSADMVTSSYLCLWVAVNISVSVSSIKFPPGMAGHELVGMRALARRAVEVRVPPAGATSYSDTCSGRRYIWGRRAEQHVDAVLDELLAAGSQLSVQVRGEQTCQAADQAGGDQFSAAQDRRSGTACVCSRLDEAGHPFRAGTGSVPARPPVLVAARARAPGRRPSARRIARRLPAAFSPT